MEVAARALRVLGGSKTIEWVIFDGCCLCCFLKTVISRGVVCLRVYTSLHPKPLLIGPLALAWFGFVLSLFFHSFALPVLWTSLSLPCLHVDLSRPSGQKKAFGSPKLMGCTASSITNEHGGLLGVLFLGINGQGNRGCV